MFSNPALYLKSRKDCKSLRSGTSPEFLSDPDRVRATLRGKKRFHEDGTPINSETSTQPKQTRETGDNESAIMANAFNMASEVNPPQATVVQGEGSDFTAPSHTRGSIHLKYFHTQSKQVDWIFDQIQIKSKSNPQTKWILILFFNIAIH